MRQIMLCGPDTYCYPRHMLRLAYMSTLQPSMTDELIDQMISKAAASNAERGITGVIALEGHRVCQIIEGEDAAVIRLFEALLKDDRHSRVTELDRKTVGDRRFPDWTMVRRNMADMVVYSYSMVT